MARKSLDTAFFAHHSLALAKRFAGIHMNLPPAAGRNRATAPPTT
jgi:hypothetical protein